MKFSGIIASTYLVLAATTLDTTVSAASFRGASPPRALKENNNDNDESKPQAATNRALSSSSGNQQKYEFKYDAYANAGCRTHDGKKGQEGHDYVTYSPFGKHDCEQTCNDWGHDCKAYEYKSGNGGRCEIWFTDVPRTDPVNGLTCYVKKDYYYYNNHNKVCRTADGDKGKEGKDYFKYTDYDCAARCDSFGHVCQAYESGPDGHCEIWTFLPPRDDHQHGYNCAFKYEYDIVFF